MALKIRPPEIDSSEEDIQLLADAFADASATVVGRDDIFDLLMIGFLTRSHILLNGGPGLGKSMIAAAAFSVFEPDDVVLYQKMMMEGTLPEEVFGPMNLRVLREKAEVTFNTKGMLPSADFAFIDEVYRGPDSILGACLGILNERTFTNGSVVDKCPLNSAVGTTNFVSDSPILEAFRDRWLFTYNVKPLESATERLAMLKLCYSGAEKKPQRRIRLKTFRELQTLVKTSKFDPKMVEMYELVVSKFRQTTTRAISDRRYAMGFGVVRAGRIVNGEDFASSFARLRHVIPETPEELNSFDTIFQSEIQSVVLREEELPVLKDFEETVAKIGRTFDPSLKTSKLRDILDAVDTLLAPDDNDDSLTFTVTEHVRRQGVAFEKLRSVRLSVVEALEKRGAAGKSVTEPPPQKSGSSSASLSDLATLFGK